MASKKKAVGSETLETPKTPKSNPPHTLAIDIGGTGVKALVLDAKGKALTERVRKETPKPATPDAVLAAIREIAAAFGEFHRVSCGFPGVVVDGVVHTAANLGTEAWRGYPLAKKLSTAFRGVPVPISMASNNAPAAIQAQNGLAIKRSIKPMASSPNWSSCRGRNHDAAGGARSRRRGRLGRPVLRRAHPGADAGQALQPPRRPP